MMTELELLVDFFKNTARQGPGSSFETLQALSLMKISKDQSLKVADIGCGSGSQTLTLANNIEGHITAVDLFPAFLDELNSRAEKADCQEKITTIEQSMDDLPFEKDEFDIIWAEGAIYNIGFENGIQKWNKFLKSGGFLAVSEITWITNSRPKEIEAFWKEECPEIDTASNKIKLLEENGYSLIGYFILSQNSWIDNYYIPMEKQFSAFLEKHENSELAEKIVAELKEEIEKYKKYKDYYSYGFYIAKKI